MTSKGKPAKPSTPSPPPAPAPAVANSQAIAHTSGVSVTLAQLLAAIFGSGYVFNTSTLEDKIEAQTELIAALYERVRALEASLAEHRHDRYAELPTPMRDPLKYRTGPAIQEGQ